MAVSGKAVGPEPSSSWENLVSAELASVKEPADIERRVHLVRAYLDAGFADASAAEIGRLFRGSPNDPKVLAEMLRHLASNGRMGELAALLARAKPVMNPPPELLAATAAALVELRQYDKAAGPLAELLGHDNPPVLGLNALGRFLRHQTHSYPVICMLQRLQLKCDHLELPVLLQYALVRSMTEWHPDRARKLLLAMPIQELADFDTLVDLAIQAFRLREWGQVIRVADRALAIAPREPLAGRILTSAYTFADRPCEASRFLLAQPESEVGVRLKRSQLAAVRQFTAMHDNSKTAWGVMPVPDGADNQHRVRALRLEQLTDALSEPTNSITVSVIGNDNKALGPWDVLMQADLRATHLMVQDTGSAKVLHAFVSASDTPDNWAWREVAISVDASRDLNGFGCLVGPKQASRNCCTEANILWMRARVELKTSHMESADERKHKIPFIDR